MTITENWKKTETEKSRKAVRVSVKSLQLCYAASKELSRRRVKDGENFRPQTAAYYKIQL